MAKIVVRVPDIQWQDRKFQFPEERAEVVKAALHDQQTRISEALAKRNEDVMKKITQATRPKPKTDKKVVVLALGLGTLAGTLVGLILAPKSGKGTRSMAGQKLNKYVNTATHQASGLSKQASSVVTNKIRQRTTSEENRDLEPETITDRVSTALGEEEMLRHLPRINVNTEPGGFVYLRGPVQTYAQREKAEEVASKVTGVTEVINEINVESGQVVQ